MTVIDEIKNRLAVLNPVSIEIGDDSALHAGHAGAKGGGGHYRMTMVSDAFIGKNTVARHRLIYGALGELMRTRIHALAIRALTADEANTQPTRKEL